MADEASSPSSSSAEKKEKMILLVSSDGEEFEIEESVAMQSKTIRNMIEDDCTDNGIPLPNVTSEFLSMVIEYCKRHADAPTDPEGRPVVDKELRAWDADFVNISKIGLETLFGLIMAANYLDIRSLMDLTCQAAADEIKDYSVEKVRELFNIENDFTEEEEAQIRKENRWAYEED